MALLAQVSTQKLLTRHIQGYGSVDIFDEYTKPGFLTLGAVTFNTSSTTDSYSLVNNPFVTGSISSFGILHTDYAESFVESGSLYISSLYFGNVGGTVAGQLTTDATATDLFWKGSKLNDQSGGGGGGITTSQLTSTTRGLGSIGYVSTSQLVSTTENIITAVVDLVNNLGSYGYISSTQLFSTVEGLGQIYSSTMGGGLASIPSTLSTSVFFTSSAVISTATIGIMSSLITNASTATINIATTSSMTTNTITVGSGSGWILTSPIQTLAISTNSVWADVTYVNTENVTTGIISTVTTNALTVGTGGGWLLTSPIQTSIVSTSYLFANQPYFDTVNIGSVSTMNSLEFYGLFGNYNNTVLAEISTGGGAQELLMFKGSSSSDRVRVQTTGNFVIETGVSARFFNSNTLLTLSNATPAFIVNSSSNVGIQTATPATTLDVAGTGRFQIVSTLNINLSSINVQAYSAGGSCITTENLTSTVTGLGSSGYLSSLSNVALISTQQIFTSSIAGNISQFVTLSSQALYVSSLYTATRQATPMFVTF